jgi:hypothetical protein
MLERRAVISSGLRARSALVVCPPSGASCSGFRSIGVGGGRVSNDADAVCLARNFLVRVSKRLGLSASSTRGAFCLSLSYSHKALLGYGSISLWAGAGGECGGGGSLHCGHSRQVTASLSRKLAGMWAFRDVSETPVADRRASSISLPDVAHKWVKGLHFSHFSRDSRASACVSKIWLFGIVRGIV